MGDELCEVRTGTPEESGDIGRVKEAFLSTTVYQDSTDAIIEDGFFFLLSSSSMWRTGVVVIMALRLLVSAKEKTCVYLDAMSQTKVFCTICSLMKQGGSEMYVVQRS